MPRHFRVFWSRSYQTRRGGTFDSDPRQEEGLLLHMEEFYRHLDNPFGHHLVPFCQFSGNFSRKLLCSQPKLQEAFSGDREFGMGCKKKKRQWVSVATLRSAAAVGVIVSPIHLPLLCFPQEERPIRLLQKLLPKYIWRGGCTRWCTSWVSLQGRTC